MIDFSSFLKMKSVHYFDNKVNIAGDFFLNPAHVTMIAGIKRFEDGVILSISLNDPMRPNTEGFLKKADYEALNLNYTPLFELEKSPPVVREIA